jgi:hypothetical protein
MHKLSIASRVELTRIVIQQAGDGLGGLPTLTMWKDPGATILSLPGTSVPGIARKTSREDVDSER